MYDRYPGLPERKDELVMILYAVLMFVFAALLLLAGIMTCLGGYDLIYDYALNRVTDLRRYAKANGIALICLCLPLIACGVLMLAAAVLWTVGSAPLRRAAGSAPAKAAPEGPAARKAEPGAARRMLPALFAAGLVWLVVAAMLHGGLKDGVTS